MPENGIRNTFSPDPRPFAATIMIVEDDNDLATLLEYRLRAEGFTPLIATDGDEACQLLETETAVELILLDILLPRKDGWDVCRCLRRHTDSRIATMPVIMLTALSSRNNRVKGLECGADIYLAKPYSMQEIVLSCRKLIGERRERHSLRTEIMSLRTKEENSTTTRQMLFHELRSHFTVIGGLCQRLLKHGTVPLGHAKGRDYLQVINQSITQVSELADEMLLLAKLDSAEAGLPREECRLDEIISEIVAVHRPAAQRKMITIHVPALPAQPVKLHRLALKIIISSLLENAVKYSPPGAIVTLGAIAGVHKIRLVVHDQGPGIPPHEHEKIFTPYYRGAATRDSHKGTGLGLYSVKRLTQALDGEVRLTSAQGESSVFLITFYRPSSSSLPPGTSTP